MSKLVSLLGLMAIFFAFVLAAATPVIPHEGHRATAAALASGVFTIALAAVIGD